MRFAYKIEGRVMRQASSALVVGGEDPLEQVVADAIRVLSTDVWLEVAGVRMHLAAWMDPDHWSEDWEEAGVDDPLELLARAQEE